MAKIGFSLQSSYVQPMPEVLNMLAGLGVHAVSPLWQQNQSTEDLVNHAVRCGLTIQSLHGPLRGLADLWDPDENHSRLILQHLLQSVDDCASLDIPVLVVHSWTGLQYTFSRETLFFDNFDRLVSYAGEQGVQIAFENLEGPEYLSALMDRYTGIPSVGFCWDSGHELCYTPDQDFLTLYGDRLLMTHLNDNLGITHPDGLLQGTDDLHLLPFDGMTDWTQTVTRLKQARHQDILNFEFKIRPKGDRCTHDLYSQIPLEQYLTNAYIQSSKVAALYE